MKVSKKYNRAGWALVLASAGGSILLAMAFDFPSHPRPAGEMVADIVTTGLTYLGLYYWGKSSGAKELGT